MSEIQLKATNVENKPVRIGDLPIIKTNILENAGQMDKGVVGGYNGAFPLTAASEGGIYLLPSTGKFYVCETAYNGAQISAPNSNFVELSVWKNHDRLNNLNLKLIKINAKIPNNVEELNNLSETIFNAVAEYSSYKGLPFFIILSFSGGNGILRICNCMSYILYEAFFQTSKYFVSTFYYPNFPVFVEK